MSKGLPGSPKGRAWHVPGWRLAGSSALRLTCSTIKPMEATTFSAGTAISWMESVAARKGTSKPHSGVRGAAVCHSLMLMQSGHHHLVTLSIVPPF